MSLDKQASKPKELREKPTKRELLGALAPEHIP
jgi:hypothetical protein